MKNILVPTDFSANADLALQYAGHLAARAGASVVIVHSGEFYQEKFASRKALVREHNELVFTDLHQKLNTLKTQTENKYTAKTTICLYNDGDVAGNILKAAKEYKADLIVMGTYGAAGLRRKLFGSKAAEIINRSRVPVLCIPPDYEWSSPATIALAVEDTLQHTETVNIVFDLAGLFQAGISVVVFSEENETFELLTHTKAIQFVQQKLKSVYGQTKMDFVHLTGDDFQESLQQFVREKNIDMLAMITRKRSFLQKIFDSSVTQKLSYYTTVPLLSLHQEMQGT